MSLSLRDVLTQYRESASSLRKALVGLDEHSTLRSRELDDDVDKERANLREPDPSQQ